MQVCERAKSKQREMTDGILAQQTLAENEEAFAQLVQRESSALFNFVFHFLQDYDAASEYHDLQDFLQHAISTLPPKFRAVVLLRYTAQMSFAEIGQSLQMPEATAKTYFQRAKPLLRTVLKDRLMVASG